jgi:hypothetical protein
MAEEYYPRDLLIDLENAFETAPRDEVTHV